MSRVCSRLFLCFLLGCAALWGAPKYVILFLGDGFGQNQRTLTEIAAGERLALDTLPARAPMTTHNVLGETTDSAASGTAIACGVKTRNGMLGQDKDGKPVESFARYLQARGFKIGIVTSSPLNDATPAAYFAHQDSRKNSRAITDEMASSGFDFFGGQAPAPGKKESSREAARLTKAALEKAGYAVREGPDCLTDIAPGQKTAALCTPLTPGFSTDQKAPTLAAFTEAAIRALDNPTGFFLMVEKGDTDYAGHQNDAGKLVRETLDFDAAVKVGLAFQKGHPADTLIIVTADHETGGLQLDNPTRETLARLFAQKSPLTELQKQVRALAKGGDPQAQEKAIALLQDALLSGEAAFTDAERARLAAVWARYVAALKDPKLDGALPGLESMYGKYAAPVVEAFRIRDARAHIRYTTFGHTNTPVWTGASGPGHEAFAQPMDNTDFYKKITAIVFPPQNSQTAAAIPSP